MHVRRPQGTGRSRGFSIVELMVAMVITMIVTLITTSFTANLFRTNTESILMIQLSQEMRSVIQLIARDIRRSGYDDDALSRYLATEPVASGVTLGTTDGNGQASCLRVQYQDLDGDPVNAVYRRRTVGGVGRLAAHFGASASCSTALDDDGWVDVTDPRAIDVLAVGFELDSGLTEIAENSATGNAIQVGVEAVGITLTAVLRENATVNRTITNRIQIRNAFLTV